MPKAIKMLSHHRCRWAVVLFALTTTDLLLANAAAAATSDSSPDDSGPPSSTPLIIDVGVGEGQIGRDEFDGDAKLEHKFDERFAEMQGYLDWYEEEWIANQTVVLPEMASCKNKNEFCVYWAVMGHCSRIDRAGYMENACAPACFTCHKRRYEQAKKQETDDRDDDDEDDEDEDDDEQEMCSVEDQPQDEGKAESQGQAQNEDEDQNVNDDDDDDDDDDDNGDTGTTWDTGVEQQMGHEPLLKSDYETNLRLTQQYFEYLSEQPREISSLLLSRCKNRVQWCSFWAAEGHCDDQPEYMLENCAPACFACEAMLDRNNKERCAMEPVAEDADDADDDDDADEDMDEDTDVE